MVEYKEACKLFYMVKGHLNTDDKTIYACYDGYFKRMWGNHELVYHEDGFEEEWERKNARI
jgi:hypothetical protein